jgi:glycosyltransferase involved in cell wall biosynthesis
MKKLLIIIPAYNEAKIIKRTLKSLRDRIALDENYYDVLVIDDGSTDRTYELARKSRIPVVKHCNNLGIGGAVQTGFKYAAENGYDMAVQFDSDGQHKAEEIRTIIKPITENKADVVIGSRFLKKKSYNSHMHRRIGIYLMSLFLSFLIGQRITDESSGFRAVGRNALLYFAKNYPVDYPDAEAILLLKYKGFRIKEVSVRMNQRMTGKSSISFFRSFHYLFKTMVSIFATILRKN